MWHRYKNGNHFVYINDKNGTKIRKTIDDNAPEFISDFADSVDFKITNKCFNNCAFCHEKSTQNQTQNIETHFMYQFVWGTDIWSIPGVLFLNQINI